MPPTQAAPLPSTMKAHRKMKGKVCPVCQARIKLIGDAPSAMAILDRFLHHATIIPMNGRSYRLKDAPASAGKPATAAKPDENA